MKAPTARAGERKRPGYVGKPLLASLDEPDVVFTIDAPDFLSLVSGGASGPELFTFGRMKVEGDHVAAAQVPRLFEWDSA